MLKFVGICAVGGLLIPIVFSIAWAMLEKHSQLYLSLGRVLEVIQLLLWPTSLMMMGTAREASTNITVLLISSIANALLYALIGTLIWYGIYKQPWALFLVFIVVAAGWYSLFTL